MIQLAPCSYAGPPFDHQSSIADQIPADLLAVLRAVNGFVQFGGGLHVRGVCRDPQWHSLEEAWRSATAISRSYPNVEDSDVPFAQDCVADQFLLRSGIVHRLFAETGAVESLDVDLDGFLASARKDPESYLGMGPLIQLQRQGHQLAPGEVVHVYPPLCTKEASSGFSTKAIPVTEALAYLAQLSDQLSRLSDGAQFSIKVV